RTDLLLALHSFPTRRSSDLQHRAEALAGGEDLGFGLFGEGDHLGVAAALEVEDAVVGPAVLVVTDEAAVGIGRERRLAGAGEAEDRKSTRLNSSHVKISYAV